MSDPVRSHQAHTSIRARSARPKSAAPGPSKRPQAPTKQLVKAALALPWISQWGDVQGGELVRMLGEGCDGVRGFHEGREKRKRVKEKPNALGLPHPTPPFVLSTITFGLNETVKRLERTRLDLEVSVDALIAGYTDFPFAERRMEGLVATAPPVTVAPVVDPSRFGTPPPPPIKVIFVCVEDINPRELVEHVPRYVASWNALVARSKERLEEWVSEGAGEEDGRRRKMQRLVEGREMWLVPLEKGSEQVLAHAVGLRRVGVMGITNAFPNIERILNHLESTTLNPPHPPFPLHPIAPTRATAIYAPTMLKAIHTTTPADPKSRKTERIAAVRAARERQKRTRAEQVEKTRRTLGWKVGGKFVGGSEQKSRDRNARWDRASRVKDLVQGRQRKKVVKEKAAERRKVVALPVGG